jgi:hypothetical protein
MKRSYGAAYEAGARGGGIAKAMREGGKAVDKVIRRHPRAARYAMNVEGVKTIAYGAGGLAAGYMIGKSRGKKKKS